MAREPKQRRQPPQVRLLQATKDLVCEEGVAGATLRKVVVRARASTNTAHALFPTKGDLIAAAVRSEFADLDRVVPSPTGQLATDLTRLAADYHDFYKARPFLIHALADIVRTERLRTILEEEQAGTTAKVAYLVAYYRDRAAFRSPFAEMRIEELREEVGSTFLAGIFGRVIYQVFELDTAPFSPQRYVEGFLSGFRDPDYREP